MKGIKKKAIIAALTIMTSTGAVMPAVTPVMAATPAAVTSISETKTEDEIKAEAKAYNLRHASGAGTAGGRKVFRGGKLGRAIRYYKHNSGKCAYDRIGCKSD